MKKLHLALLALLWASAAFCSTIYVKPDGNGNGTSWDLAYGSLTTAFQNAVSGDEIWVAQGTYTPHPTDINASFIFKNGVKLYGGFAGTETTLQERADQAGATTFLSGHLSETLRSKIILKAANAASTLNLIDGFIIHDAHNTGTNLTNGGAGIQILNSTIELRNLSIKNNTISVTITNPAISGFAGGAGLYSYQSDVSLYNVNVQNNTATVESTGFPQISTQGAGIFAYNGSFIFNKGIIEANELIGNNQNIAGAGIALLFVSTPDLKNIKFIKNYLENSTEDYVHGGGLNIDGSTSIEITQCLFHDNECNTGSSRALHIVGGVTTITNSTIGPKYQAEGILFENADASFRNCVILQQISANSLNNLQYYNTLSSYSLPASTIVENSELATMEFINPFEGNYTPQPCSSHLGYGNSNYITEETDINGDSRIVGAGIEPGAIESQNTWGNIIYVDANTNNLTQDGSSWENAFTSLDDALNCGCTTNEVTVRPQEIWVAQGVYNAVKKTYSFQQGGFNLNNNQKVYGGFTPGAVSLDERDVDFDTNQTTLSGLMENNEYSIHVVVSEDNDTSAELNGFIIQDGRSFEPGSIIDTGGAGVLVYNSHPTLKNLWIRNNEPTQYGGGILFYHAEAEMENIRISNNNAYSGGAIAFYNSNPTNYEVNIKNIEIYDNTAEAYGGAMEIAKNYTVNINGFNIYDNSALNIGGAIYMTDAKANLSGGKFDNNTAIAGGAIAAYSMLSKIKAESVVFNNNSASNASGAIFAYICDADLTNCTFVNNTAINGANLIGSQGATVKIKNSIIDNPDNGIPVVGVFPASTATNPNLTIEDSMVTDGFTTIFTHLDNVELNTDPLFVDKENGDYSLTACGPPIDAGTNSYLTLNTEFDTAGNNRIENNRVDLGALEFQYMDIEITQQPEDLTVGAGAQVIFEVVTEVIANLNYQWQVSSDNGTTWTNIPDATSSTLVLSATAAMNNNIYRCVIFNCEYASTSAAGHLIVSGTAGIEETSKNSFMLYPNPATQQFTIQMENAFEDSTVSIYDVQGRIIYQKSTPASLIQEGFTINTTQWAAGVYIVNWNNSSNKQTVQVIKK